MQSVTINLPDHMYQRLATAAQTTQKPLDTMVLQSIQAGLPPDLSHVPARFQIDLHQMNQMSDTLLHQFLIVDLTSEQSTRYEALLDKNQTETLAPAEQKRLDILREEADLFMFRRAYAASLLNWRGDALPAPAFS